MFTLYSKNSWFIHVLAKNEKKSVLLKLGNMTRMRNGSAFFSGHGACLFPSLLHGCVKVPISCMLRAILNKCTFEFILDGKITLLYQDNMF